MIPWVREKFAEKRAKWLARNKRSSANSSTHDVATNSSFDTGIVSSAEALSAPLNGSTRSLPVTARNNCSPTSTRTTSTQTQIDYRNCLNVVLPITSCNAAVGTTTTAQQTPPQFTSTAMNTDITPETAHLPPLRIAASISQPEQQQQQQQIVEYSDDDDELKTHVHISAAAEPEGAEAVEPILEYITVRIVCPSSRVMIFKVDITKRLSDLKSEVILEISDDPDSIQLFAADVRHLNPRYRLLRAEYHGSELNENLTLAQLHVRNMETLMLVQRRSVLQQYLTHTREVPGPNDQIVETATRYLPSNSNPVPLIDINEIFQQSNIQYDVRKVLISLAQASAAIIGAGPYAPRLIVMLKQRLVNRRSYLVDTLQCLVDMGFKREIAEYALKANNYVYSTTLEWLIQNQSEDSSVEEHANIALQRSQSSISPSGIVTNNDTVENTAALLEIVRIYSRRDVPPNEEIIESLTEMGFTESEVVAALKKTGNNKAAAAEWLCGNRTPSLTELRDGLSPESHIQKVILEMPQVQLNLANPKAFLAFIAILENEQAIRVWRGDTETTSVITHILQKYHEEKHVLGINQFYGNR